MDLDERTYILELLKNLRDIDVKSSRYQTLLDEIYTLPNLNIYFVVIHPQIKWDIEKLSKHPNITPQWIQQLPDKKWNFQSITEIIFNSQIDYSRIPFNLDYDYFQSLKKNLKLQWLKLYPTADWNYNFIFLDDKFNLEMLKLIPEKHHNYTLLNKCPLLDLEWIQAFPQGEWNFKELSRHRNLKLDWLTTLPDKNWNFNFLSLNPNLELEWIIKFPKEDWSFNPHNLSLKNPELIPYQHIYDNILTVFYDYKFQMEWFEKYPALPWDFNMISNIESLDLNYLKKYPDLPWNFSRLGANSNLTLSILETNQDKDWDFDMLSQNSQFTLKWYYLFPDAPWNFKHLSELDNFNSSWVIELPDKDWNLKKLLKITKGQDLILAVANYLYYYPENKIIDLEELNNFKFYYDIKLNTVLYFMRPDLVSKLNILNLIDPEVLKYPALTDTEKFNYLDFLKYKIKIKKLIPEMFSYPDYDLELTDLSGDTYYLPDWFDSKNIMEDIHRTFPELGKIDILIEDELYDKMIFGSKHNNKQLIEKLCHLPNGPQAMIIYPEESENEEQESDNEFEYYDLW